MSFQVPQDLLMQWSPPLGEMCRSGLEESQTRIIPLPHVKISTFEDFLIWMHAYEPSVDLKSLASVLDLAIFAEMYMICQLKNQTSDILHTELGGGRWQLTPDDVSMIYDEVPSGSTLRQLCSVSLALAAADPPSSSGFGSSSPYGHSSVFGSLANFASTHRQHYNYLEWESVFKLHSDLGWDYFEQIQTRHAQTAINWGGPCRFHDHRDIPGVRREDVDKCPYPRGPLPMECRTRSMGSEYHQEVSVEAQPIGNDVEEEARPVLEEPQPILEEPPAVVEEAEPVEEPQPVEEVPFWE